MSRLVALRQHPRRTLGALTVVLAAVGVAVGSGASFTSSSASNTNVFTAGTLHHSTTPTGSIATATLSNIKPGFGTTNGTAVDTAGGAAANYGTLTIANDGSLPGTFSVTTTASGTAYSGTNPPAAEVCGGGQGSSGTCSALDGALKVKIDHVNADATTTQVYDGVVSGLAGNHLLETAYTLASGVSQAYRFYFYLPNSGNQNAYQGGSATVDVAISEVQ